MCGLLLLLDERAAAAAARRRDIDEAAAVEVVLLAHLRALHGQRDPVEADAGRSAKQETLDEEKNGSR